MKIDKDFLAGVYEKAQQLQEEIREENSITSTNIHSNAQGENIKSMNNMKRYMTLVASFLVLVVGGVVYNEWSITNKNSQGISTVEKSRTIDGDVTAIPRGIMLFNPLEELITNADAIVKVSPSDKNTANSIIISLNETTKELQYYEIIENYKSDIKLEGKKIVKQMEPNDALSKDMIFIFSTSEDGTEDLNVFVKNENSENYSNKDGWIITEVELKTIIQSDFVD